VRCSRVLFVLAVLCCVTGRTEAAEPCTLIPVELAAAVDSSKARAGDVFRFRTIDTIVVPGGVTVPRNAVGYGIVTAASVAGAHGKAGGLVIEARYIELREHRAFQVTIDSVASSAVRNGSAENAPSGVSVLPIPFAGTAVGAYNYFHAGKNVAIKPGFRFVVVPVDDLFWKTRCGF
jgi:hypothetical protein